MKRMYERISLRIHKDIKHAERLQAYGWKIISVGCESVVMQRPITKEKFNVN